MGFIFVFYQKNYVMTSKTYIVAILAFCVASSKHIIIYNEELLVAITFFCFVLYIKTAFGTSIKESLDEGRESILQELQSLAIHKKKASLELKNLHEKVPLMEKSLESIENYISCLVKEIGDIAENTLFSTAKQQITLRCEQGSLSQPLFTAYQQTMSDSFLPGLFVSIKKNEKSNLKSKALSKKTAKKALFLLQSTK